MKNSFFFSSHLFLYLLTSNHSRSLFIAIYRLDSLMRELSELGWSFRMFFSISQLHWSSRKCHRMTVIWPNECYRFSYSYLFFECISHSTMAIGQCVESFPLLTLCWILWKKVYGNHQWRVFKQQTALIIHIILLYADAWKKTNRKLMSSLFCDTKNKTTNIYADLKNNRLHGV